MTERPCVSPRMLRTAIVCAVLNLACLIFFVRAVHCEESNKSDEAFRLTTAIFASLAVVDIVQTTRCGRAGSCVERNPIYRPVAKNYAEMAAMKAGIVTGVAVTSWKLRRRRPKLAWTILISATVAQGAAVAWNAHQLRGMR